MITYIESLELTFSLYSLPPSRDFLFIHNFNLSFIKALLITYYMLGVSRSVTFDSETPWTVVCQAPLSMEFSRQEYWSGLPFPSPEDLPDLGIQPRSPALQADSLPGAVSSKEPTCQCRTQV